jgi:hypothetical protein
VVSRSVRAFLAAAAAVVLAAGPSAARSGPVTHAQETPLQIFRIAAISPWTDETHPFRVTVQITNPTELALENARVRVSVSGRVLSRSQLRQALDGGNPTETLGSLQEPVDGTIAPGEATTVKIERPIAELIGSIARRGVYPIQVSVEHSRGTATLSTAVPYFPPGDIEPLNITWILPISAPTVRPSGGGYTETEIATLDIARLTQQVRAIAARPGANVTLAPGPILLDTLQDLADGFELSASSGTVAVGPDGAVPRAAAGLLDTLRRSAQAAGEIATVPYAPADLAALARHGLGGDALRQITLGRSVTQQVLGRSAALSVLVPPGGAIDTASASALSPLGISGVVVDPSLLPEQPVEPFQPQFFGPSRPITFTGGALRALLPDTQLSLRMQGAEQGVLLAQAIIAETASSSLELPSLASDRVLVINSPARLAPTALGSLLSGLKSAPWVHMLPASQAFEEFPPEGAPLRMPVLSRAGRLFLDDSRRARSALSTLSAITVSPLPSAEGLDRSILASESDEWAGAPGLGTTIARGVQNEVAAILSRIRVGTGRRVTLTSQSGSVPVTLINGNAFPVRLRIQVSSAKVGFPQGAAQLKTVFPPNATIDFTVQARTAGSFPLDVLVETPDGLHLLARGSVILRSSAVSAVTLLVVGGSTFFLLLAWVQRSRRRERAGRAETPASPADSA